MATNDAPRRPRDAARTRRLLLDAARRRFAGTGYAATTVRDIADDVGVNVALVNRYFASKEGLFEACLAAAVEELRETTGDVPAERIPQAIARQAAGPTDGGHPNQVLLLLLRSSGDEKAEQIRLGYLRSFGERLASVTGWTPGDPDEPLLRAQIVMATSIGIVILRSLPALDPIATAAEADLVAPLRDLVEAVLRVS